jgi:hypothetical protein
MKPLIRWTMGPACPEGYRLLLESIFRFKKIYDFDMVVCYNNQESNCLDFIKSLGVDVLDQSTLPQKFEVKDAFWKLVPFRLRPEGHEIFIDNDLVIWDKIPEVDQFLDSKATLIYQGMWGKHGVYNLPVEFNVNSGIFGVPPNFDLEKHILDSWKNPYVELEDKTIEFDRFSEQGLVGTALLKNDSYIVIPQCRIPILETYFSYELHRKNLNAKGFHFVGSNTKYNSCFYRFLIEMSQRDKQKGLESSINLWNKLKKLHSINDMWKISRETMV